MKEKLLDSVEKLTNQKHINAIKKGMMAYVPFTIEYYGVARPLHTVK